MLLLVTIQVLALRGKCDLNALEAADCPQALHLRRFGYYAASNRLLTSIAMCNPWCGRDIYIAISLMFLSFALASIHEDISL